MTQNDFQLLNQKALRYLANREHSRFELRQKLQTTHLDREIIDAVLDNLADRGYQSDRRFAESYTRYRINKGYGELYIRRVLQQRGVSNDIVSVVLAEQAHVWFDLVCEVQHKRFTTTPNGQREYAKQVRFLQYRGFTQEQIRYAFDNTK
ncbi:regulatory protein RecX [Candidatus Albibeggiatoa sp. nov. NOAA]|uniref:regulatory protein RecX n=1 Tax=Candidatus Albibeggiatoa sp. nov. NOAA TaxID=3162724 RepID=UPI0032F7036C|nr:recombination regulator RecX [Thiotrichaceae bacterium]